MPTRRLGRTEMQVTVAALGSGGHSRLGLSQGASDADAVGLVTEAIDRGVNLVDTAALYGTEAQVGAALRARPERRVEVATKVLAVDEQRHPLAPNTLHREIEQGLERLGLDRVGVLFLHGVEEQHYDAVKATALPVLDRLRSAGRIGSVGVTEAFASDTSHRMLSRAVTDPDDCWDVIMVGFNVLNQTARDRVLAPATERDIGVLGMFAVRRALTSLETLLAELERLEGEGALTRKVGRKDLESVLEPSGTTSVADLAYRYCAAEPGIHAVLFGTGSPAHLRDNLVSITGPALPPAVHGQLTEWFEGMDATSAN